MMMMMMMILHIYRLNPSTDYSPRCFSRYLWITWVDFSRYLLCSCAPSLLPVDQLVLCWLPAALRDEHAWVNPQITLSITSSCAARCVHVGEWPCKRGRAACACEQRVHPSAADCLSVVCEFVCVRARACASAILWSPAGWVWSRAPRSQQGAWSSSMSVSLKDPWDPACPLKLFVKACQQEAITKRFKRLGRTRVSQAQQENLMLLQPQLLGGLKHSCSDQTLKCCIVCIFWHACVNVQLWFLACTWSGRERFFTSLAKSRRCYYQTHSTLRPWKLPCVYEPPPALSLSQDPKQRTECPTADFSCCTLLSDACCLRCHRLWLWRRPQDAPVPSCRQWKEKSSLN